MSQMLGKVRIDAPGDTDLLPGEFVDHHKYEEINSGILAEGGEPATASPVLLGITRASLNMESFLAAASFQETTSGSYRGGHQRPNRLPEGTEGERHHRAADPGSVRHVRGRQRAPSALKRPRCWSRLGGCPEPLIGTPLFQSDDGLERLPAL